MADDDEDRDYPESLLRGVTRPDYLIYHDAGGDILASQSAFEFKENRDKENRHELSINWNDDAGSLENLKIQKRDDTTSKYVAAAELQTTTLRDLKSRHAFFDFERDALAGHNDYHGNVLVVGMTEKKILRMIQSALALHARVTVF